MPPSCDGPTTTLLKHGQWWRRSAERNRRRSRVHRRYPVTMGLRLNKTASRRVGLSFNPIAVGFAEEDHCRYQRTFAQSPSRFDTATFQLGLPYLRDAGPLPQVALSDLQRLEGARSQAGNRRFGQHDSSAERSIVFENRPSFRAAPHRHSREINRQAAAVQRPILHAVA